MYQCHSSNVERLAEVVAFAEQHPKGHTLRECFEQLQRIADAQEAEISLGGDFAPYSLTFGVWRGERCILNGGVIFHGAHDNGGDGSAPTYSVNLNPHDGWSIHT